MIIKEKTSMDIDNQTILLKKYWNISYKYRKIIYFIDTTRNNNSSS
jgi:hypothetical protein